MCGTVEREEDWGSSEPNRDPEPIGDPEDWGCSGGYTRPPILEPIKDSRGRRVRISVDDAPVSRTIRINGRFHV